MREQGSAIADAFLRGTRLLRAGQCEEALTEYRVVYAAAEASDDTELMATCLCEMAWACYRYGRAEQGLECAMGSKWLWERLDNKVELARCLTVQAILFLDLGFTDEAFDAAARALTIAEAQGDLGVLAFALSAKGVVLTLCREEAMGADLLRRAVALAGEQGNKAAWAYYLLNLGFVHAKMAESAALHDQQDRASAERETAIGLCERAMEKANACGDFWTLRTALGNCAEMHALQGRHEEALSCLHQSAELPGDPGPSIQIHYLYARGDVLMRVGRVEEALVEARQALALAEVTNQIDHQVNATGKLAEILEVMGDLRGALMMQKRFHALHVRQSGETAGRRARIEEIKAETKSLRSRAAILADQAMSDPLTGIANRRSFDQILNRLAGTPFSVAIVDLDHFKAVNDRYSHIVGDAVLQRVARLMVDQLGPHGHAARLGGEEFALVLPDAPIATAAAVCEGLRIAVASNDWSVLGEGLGVTISIGLSSGTGYEPSGELMQLADTRLYMAKANGRNCVVDADLALPIFADHTLR